MNLKQTAKNNMYKAVQNFLSANTTAFDSFPRAKTETELLGSQNKKLDGYIAQQAGSSKGATDQKDERFTSMVALTIKACRKALVYAKDTNNTTLAQLFDVQVHDLEHLPGKTALAHIENMYDALEPLNGQLADYRVTAENIKAVGDAIDAYQKAGGAPENAKAFAEAGTKGIETTMPLIDASLDMLDDLIIHGMDDDPDLVNAYRKVRRVTNTGTRHTGLVATINDAAGKSIEGATMLVQELNKKAVSDILGVADIESMKPGMYHVIFSADGYTSQTQILKIEQGKTVDAEVTMVREI